MQAALDLLRREGAEAVSIRRLAAELEVTPPTIYAYVSNKADLFVSMLDSFFAAAPLADADASDWVGELRRIYSMYFQLYMNNPHMLQLLTSSGLRTERTERIVEANFALLMGVGFSPQESYLINRSLGHFLIGCATLEIARRQMPSEGDDALIAWPEETSPTMAAYVSEMQATSPDLAFSFGLDMLLDSAQRRRVAARELA